MNQPTTKALSWFFRARTVLFPTPLGWLILSVLLASPFVAWALWGESALCLTRREPASVLIVEGWIGDEGIKAAAAEFVAGNYSWAVASGGPNGENWHQKHWTYAEIARDRLLVYGVPREKIIMAPAPATETQRTHTAAIHAKQAITAAGLNPKSLNLYTLGSHARRSRLVFANVFESGTKVGVISWLPAEANHTPWWHSTTRSKALLTETVGYCYEMVADLWR